MFSELVRVTQSQKSPKLKAFQIRNPVTPFFEIVWVSIINAQQITPSKIAITSVSHTEILVRSVFSRGCSPKTKIGPPIGISHKTSKSFFGTVKSGIFRASILECSLISRSLFRGVVTSLSIPK